MCLAHKLLHPGPAPARDWTSEFGVWNLGKGQLFCPCPEFASDDAEARRTHIIHCISARVRVKTLIILMRSEHLSGLADTLCGYRYVNEGKRGTVKT